MSWTPVESTPKPANPLDGLGAKLLAMRKTPMGANANGSAMGTSKYTLQQMQAALSTLGKPQAAPSSQSGVGSRVTLQKLASGQQVWSGGLASASANIASDARNLGLQVGHRQNGQAPPSMLGQRFINPTDARRVQPSSMNLVAKPEKDSFLDGVASVVNNADATAAPVLGAVSQESPQFGEALNVANEFTGGLGSALFPQTAAQIGKATTTGVPLIDNLISAGEGVLPYVNPLAPITAPIAMAGGVAANEVRLARGEETPTAATIGDLSLPVGIGLFGAASKIGSVVPRILANAGVGLGMYGGQQLATGQPVTAGGAIGAGLTAGVFGLGHAEAPAEAQEATAEAPAPTPTEAPPAMATEQPPGNARPAPVDNPAVPKMPGGGVDPHAAFVDRMAPYAERASRATGLSQDFILGQWAHESNFGLSSVAQTGNLAGIKTAKGAQEGTLEYRGFSSPDDFTNQYIKTINGPRYKDVRALAKSGASAEDVAQALHEHGYAEDPDYGAKVAIRVNQVNAVLQSKGTTDAVQPGTAQNSIEQPQGTQAGAVPSEIEEAQPAPSETEGSQSAQAQSSDNTAAPENDNQIALQDENGVQIDKPVLPVQTGTDDGSNSAQHQDLDGGVQENGQDRTDNTEIAGSRTGNFDSDSGGEGIRQSVAGADESGTRPEDGETNAVNVGQTGGGEILKEGVDYGARPALKILARGNDTKIVTPSGETYDAYYAVGRLSDLTPSNDPYSFGPHPDFPPNIQERDYQNSEDEQAKVMRIGANLDPDRIITDAPVSDVGPAMVDEKGRIAGGTGRDMGTERAFSSDPTAAPRYQASLAKKVAQFGIDPSVLESEPDAVLFRVLKGVELKSDQPSAALMRDLNNSQTTEKEATSEAISAGRSLTPKQHEALGAILAGPETNPHETLSDAFSTPSTNKKLIRALEQGNIITNEKRPRYVQGTQRGPMLTDAGKDFVTDLIVSRVVPDADLARTTPPAIKQKLARAALPLAQAGRYDGWSLEQPIHDALQDMSAQRASGLNDDEWEGQMSFDREPLSPEAQSMRNLLADSRQKPLQKFAQEYLREARADKGEASEALFDKPLRDPTASIVRLSKRNTGKDVDVPPIQEPVVERIPGLSKEEVHKQFDELSAHLPKRQQKAGHIALDLASEDWSRTTGRPAEEYFPENFVGTQGELPGDANALEQSIVPRSARAQELYDRILDRFPSMPHRTADEIARNHAEVLNGPRTAESAKNYARQKSLGREDDIANIVAAHLRHTNTDYDQSYRLYGLSKEEARARSQPQIDQMLRDYSRRTLYQAMKAQTFHGSAQEFERFSDNKIGTGEGQQAYGYGHYATDDEEISNYYAEQDYQRKLRVHIADKLARPLLDVKDADKLTDSELADAKSRWLDRIGSASKEREERAQGLHAEAQRMLSELQRPLNSEINRLLSEKRPDDGPFPSAERMSQIDAELHAIHNQFEENAAKIEPITREGNSLYEEADKLAGFQADLFTLRSDQVRDLMKNPVPEPKRIRYRLELDGNFIDHEQPVSSEPEIAKNLEQVILKHEHASPTDLFNDTDKIEISPEAAWGDIVHELTITYGGPEASKMLQEAGADGIRYAAAKGLKGSDVHNYVVFNPDHIHVLDKTYFQDARAAVSFIDDGRAILHFTKAADITSLYHELGHIWRRTLDPERLAIAEKWAGVKNGIWDRDAEEKFALGFEQYLREGIAPNSRVKAIFEDLKQWFTNTYSHIKGSLLNLEISPEMRKVYDSFFGGSDEENPMTSTLFQSAKPEENTTGLRKSVIDEERAARGQAPIEAPLEKEFGKSWQEAADAIRDNPNKPELLANELKKKPRALDDVDAAMLLHHRIDLRNNSDKALHALNALKTNGTEPEIKNAQALYELTEGKLSDFETSIRPSITKTARGLSALRMFANDDYSLAGMRERAKATTKGPWTSEKENALRDAHAKIQELQDAIKEKETAQSTAFVSQQAQDYFDSLKKASTADRSHVATRLRQKAAQWDKEADEALARMGLSLHAGVPPEAFEYLAKKSAAILARGAATVTEMAEKLRASVKGITDSQIGTILARAQELHAEAGAAAMKERGVPTADEATKSVTKGPVTRKNVYDLMRAHFNNGLTDFHENLTQTTKDIQNVHPELSESDVAGIFSEYGKIRVPSPDEDKVALRNYKALARSLKQQESIAAGKNPLATGIRGGTPSDEVLHAQRETNELLRNSGLTQVDFRNPDPKEIMTALTRAKRGVESNMKDIQERRANKNYAPKSQKGALKPDAELEGLRRNLVHEKAQFEQEREKERLNNRTKWEKRWDLIPKISRMNVLSNVTIAPKLLMSALGERGMMFAPDEWMGAILSKINILGSKTVAEQAPIEGGYSAEAFRKNYEGLFGKEGFGDAILKARNRQTSLEEADALEKARGDAGEWTGYLGSLHGLVKAGPRRGMYDWAAQKLWEYYGRHGQNPDEPGIAQKNADEARNYSKRAQFTQSNAMSKFFSMAKAFARSHGAVGRGFARGLEAAQPITTVGGNVVNLAMTRTFGVPDALARMAWYKMKGELDNLPPEQADLIMRHLKQGWVGPAMLGLGMLSTGTFGGFYVQGEKRDASDLKADEIKGLPPWMGHTLSHFSPLMVAQLGATIARAYHEQRVKGKDPLGAGKDAILTGGLGLASSVPLLGFVAQAGSFLSNPASANRYVTNFAKTLLEPGVVQEAAQWTDPSSLKRTAEGDWQQVELGAPGLRENVPITRATQMSGAVEDIRNGKSMQDVHDAANGALSWRDVKVANKEAQMNPVELRFRRLPLNEAMNAYRLASPADRAIERRVLALKMNSKTRQRGTPAEERELRTRFYALQRLPFANAGQ